MDSSQFRAKVALDEQGNITSEVLVYKRDGEKGEWVKFTEQIPPTEEYDRSAGMFAVLRPEKFKKLVIWCYQKAVELEYPGKIVGREGTEGRGLQQAAAKLIIMALLADPENPDFQKAQKSFNRSLWKGFRKTIKDPKKLQELDQRFAGYTLNLSTKKRE